MPGNIIKSNRPDGRFQSLGGWVHHRYKNTQPKLAFNPEFTQQQFQVWRDEVSTKLRELLVLPEPSSPQPEPCLIDEQPRDGYRLQRWELYPFDYCVVPMLMLIPDKATDTEPLPAVICLPGSEHPLERLAGEPEPEGSPENRFPKHNCMGLHVVRNGMIALCMENPGTGSMIEPEIEDWRRQAWDLVWLGLNYEGISVSHKLAAFHWLQKHPLVDETRIAACGHSLGGKPAMLLGLLEPTLKASVWNSLAYDHRGHSVKTNLGRIAPWQFIPGLLHWFDYLDLMAALAPTPLMLSEGARSEELEKVQQAYKLADAPENLEVAYQPNYRDPAKRVLDQVPMPEGLSREEYLSYMNTDVNEHFFQYDTVIPWLRRQLCSGKRHPQ